jgi:hypothetical protein
VVQIYCRCFCIVDRYSPAGDRYNASWEPCYLLNFKLIGAICAIFAFVFVLYAASGLINFGATLTRPLAGQPVPTSTDVLASASAAGYALEVGFFGALVFGFAAWMLWRLKS